MQNLIFSLNATMPVFFVMVVGYLLGRMGFLPPAFCKAADKLCFKITLPVMLFLNMGSVDILHEFQPKFVLFCFAATRPMPPHPKAVELKIRLQSASTVQTRLVEIFFFIPNSPLFCL